jgi:hypothetical protein
MTRSIISKLIPSIVFSLGFTLACASPPVQGPVTNEVDNPRDETSGKEDESARELQIEYESPFLGTDSLELNGWLRPASPWMPGLCAKVTGKEILSCTLRVPGSASSILLSVHAQGDGGANAWSCGEDPCGSKAYADVGTLTVRIGAKYPIRII